MSTARPFDKTPEFAPAVVVLPGGNRRVDSSRQFGHRLDFVEEKRVLDIEEIVRF